MRLTPLLLLTLLLLPCEANGQGGRGPDRAPAVGSKAPDLALHRLEADGTQSKETVKLSEVCQKQPVALVFGSYT